MQNTLLVATLTLFFGIIICVGSDLIGWPGHRKSGIFLKGFSAFQDNDVALLSSFEREIDAKIEGSEEGIVASYWLSPAFEKGKYISLRERPSGSAVISSKAFSLNSSSSSELTQIPVS